VLPPVRGHLGAQGLVGEATDHVGERGHRSEESHGPRITAHCRGPLTVVDAREHERFENGRVR
jgi:hypothetical protein